MQRAQQRNVESRLEARLDQLVHARAAVRHSGDGMRDSELSNLDNHPGERATELHDSELDETTEMFLLEQERRIAEARHALANGTYGSCHDCHRPIAPERLLAVPEAVRCLDCQRHFEGLQRQRTRP